MDPTVTGEKAREARARILVVSPSYLRAWNPCTGFLCCHDQKAEVRACLIYWIGELTFAGLQPLLVKPRSRTLVLQLSEGEHCHTTRTRRRHIAMEANIFLFDFFWIFQYLRLRPEIATRSGRGHFDV